MAHKENSHTTTTNVAAVAAAAAPAMAAAQSQIQLQLQQQLQLHFLLFEAHMASLNNGQMHLSATLLAPSSAASSQIKYFENFSRQLEIPAPETNCVSIYIV